MALFKKVLTNVGDAALLGTANEENGAVSVQLPAGAIGTYVLEATLNGNDWQQLTITNMGTKTDGLTMTIAGGIYYAEYIGFAIARVRKTVGNASELITMAVNDE